MFHVPVIAPNAIVVVYGILCGDMHPKAINSFDEHYLLIIKHLLATAV